MHWAVALTKQLVDVDLVCARVQKGSGPRDLAVALGSTVELIGQKIKNALSLIIHSAFPLTVCDPDAQACRLPLSTTTGDSLGTSQGIPL